MIDELSISNLGVIGDATLPLGPGLTVLTGETGAGKTMVVSALGLLLGRRGDPQAIREGATAAVVEGRWSIDDAGEVAERVRDAGGEVDAGELILARSVSGEGRSRAVVGGRSTPVGVLAELGEKLVVVHGQSDQLRLRSATAQREALDRFAGEAAQSVLVDYVAAFHGWQTTQAELELLVAERDRRAREADGLRVAIAEIEAAAPISGEVEELAAKAERLANLEDLRLAASGAHEHLASEEIGDPRDVLGHLDAARRQLERVAVHDDTLVPLVDLLHDISYRAVDVSGQIATYLGDLDADTGRELDAVQERLALLGTLQRKYGPTLDDAIDYLDTGSARLLELDHDGDRIESLTTTLAADEAEVTRLADELSFVRSTAASELSDRVTAELASLAMGASTLTVEVSQRAEFTTIGRDQVAFLLRSRAGAEPRPLGRGASGGELSRVMLAIEVVIAGSDPVPTFVFDEVDAGVGGASAIEVGRRLAGLALTSQVIVVTHLAQVAAFADNHLLVLKDADGTATISTVRRLDGDHRTAEMARLLSGLPDSESGLEHARELIRTAQRLSD